MTTLDELVALVQLEVPAADSVPSNDQYERAVKDAVIDFSRRCGLEKFGQLAIISGTATYSLPDDFLKMILLESLENPNGIIISDNGLIPVEANWDEKHTIINKQITFKPTPGYTLTRDYRYKAGWIFDSEENLLGAGDEEIQIILLKAAAICFQKQANADAGSMSKYSLGAVSVELGSPADSKVTDAGSKEKEYLAACDVYNGAKMVI
jgi:hypothetical protein